MKKYKFDYIVIGSGIAGLSAAIKLVNHGNVAIISKDEINETSSRYAQGGIAAAMLPKDSIKSHYEDTLKAGCFHNKKSAVRILTEEGPARVRELIEYGVNFDLNDNKELKFAKEGAHSEARIIHHKDYTGYEITRNLIKIVKNHKNIQIFPSIFIKNLITENDEVIGCYGFNKKDQYLFNAKATILASGGFASIYQYSSNPAISTGDGITLAASVGCKLKDLEFIQFHPTGFCYEKDKIFLITEAVRGAGAKLVNHKYQTFMHNYHQDAELAARDIVTRAIYFESKANQLPIYLDFSSIKNNVSQEFPQIYQFCLNQGFDLKKDLLPVTPCSHFTMGGVVTDLSGKTNINRLYAIGEVAWNGCHGANRLASNSLLDGLVFAHKSAIDIIKKDFSLISLKNYISYEKNSHDLNIEEIKIIKKQIQKILWENVSIIRSIELLKTAQKQLKAFNFIYQYASNNQILCETQNMLMLGNKIIRAAIRRKKSLGSHYIDEKQIA